MIELPTHKNNFMITNPVVDQLTWSTEEEGRCPRTARCSCRLASSSPPPPPSNSEKVSVFIGPESDHCLPLSLTHSLTDQLTHSCLENFIDVVTVIDVDDEK